MWNKAGPFHLQAAIDAKKVTITQDLPIIHVELRPGVFYYGQTPTILGSFIGKIEGSNFIDEGVFSSNPSDDLGMSLKQYGRGFIAERSIVAGKKRARFRTFVWRNGVVKEGRWDGKRFLG